MECRLLDFIADVTSAIRKLCFRSVLSPSASLGTFGIVEELGTFGLVEGGASRACALHNAVGEKFTVLVRM